MCTMIVKTTPIDGYGKTAGGWIRVQQVHVSYDHPFHAPLEHALNIDFVNAEQGPGARVAVELTVEAAQNLVETIQAVLAQAEGVEKKTKREQEKKGDGNELLTTTD